MNKQCTQKLFQMPWCSHDLGNEKYQTISENVAVDGNDGLPKYTPIVERAGKVYVILKGMISQEIIS